MPNIAIKVDSVGKMYRIFDKPQDRLKDGILWRWGKRYGHEFWALKDISFEVKKGESVGIIGRNGSGKSTLLQIIAGTLQPTTGNVQVNGRVAALLELGSGFNPDYTGRENVYMNAAILGLSREETDNKFDAIASFADIGQFLEQPVKTYSSGMMVRLAFAVQTAVDPDVLIIDEALAVGDAYFVQRCMLRFHELQAQGTTILFVSHDATAVRSLCRRAIWIDQGHIAMAGTSVEITDHYLAHLFDQPVVSPPLNSSRETTDKSALAPGVHEKNRPFVAHETTIPNIDRRTGDQSCSIVGIGLYNTAMEPICATLNDTEVVLRMTIRNNFTDRSVQFDVGYTFRDFRGLDISSSNNTVTDTDLGLCPPEALVTVIMTIQLPILYPGQYSFSPSIGYIRSDGTLIETDRIQNAIVFEIASASKVHIGMRFKTEFKLDMPSCL